MSVNQFRKEVSSEQFATTLAERRPLYKPVPNDPANLVGNWKLISIQSGLEEERDYSQSARNTLEITETQMITHGYFSDQSRLYLTDTKSQPMKLDTIDMDTRRQKLEIDRYIFQVEGDILRRATLREDRPASFDPQEGVTVATFKRISPADATRLHRLGQVNLQTAPPFIVMRPDVRRELGLTSSQQGDIDTILREVSEEFRSLRVLLGRANSEQEKDDLKRRRDELHATTRDRIIDSIFSPEQQEKWRSMLGEPATEEELKQIEAQD